MVDTWLTLDQHHSQESSNLQLTVGIGGHLPTIDWLLIDWVSTEYWCPLSIDRDVDQGYWSRVSLNTWLWVPPECLLVCTLFWPTIFDYDSSKSVLKRNWNIPVHIYSSSITKSLVIIIQTPNDGSKGVHFNESWWYSANVNNIC